MNSKSRSVDFICAGAQKAGTTWLYYRLKELPEFTLPPVKELHYFDRSRDYPSLNHLAKPYLYQRLRKAEWTKYAIKSLFAEIKKGNYKEFKWLTKWFFSTYDDDWYVSLFDSLNGITGEITPDYSILDKSDVEKIYRIAPEAKIVFLLRNPVYRAWSNFRFNKYEYNHSDLPAEGLDKNEIIHFMNKRGVELRSNYVRTLNNYTSVYPKNQILIGFYDAIRENPEELLTNIVEFIGGDASNVAKKCNLNVKNNVSKKVEMPAEIEEFLKEKYRVMIGELSETYGGYFTKWHHDLYGSEEKNYSDILPKPISILN